MKKFLMSIVTLSVLVSTSLVCIYANEIGLKAVPGKVQTIRNMSNQSKLDITAIVPSPISTKEHQISGLCFEQNCEEPHGDCEDLPYLVKSSWSSTGAKIVKYDYAHGNYDREPKVEGYRTK